MIDDLLTALALEATPARYPSGYYSPDGDCLFFYQDGGEYFGQRVDSLLTVFRSIPDRRIVGLQVKGISKLPSCDGVGVQVAGCSDGSGGRVDIVQILLLSFKRAPDADSEAERSEVYAEALGLFGTRSTEVELASPRR